MKALRNFQLQIGAQPEEDGVRFRVWAPKRRSVQVVAFDQSARIFDLQPEGNGYFSGLSPDFHAGDLYKYRLDEKEEYADICSRYLPEGPHGPSQILNPRTFKWTDDAWPGIEMKGQVFYELHVGAFSKEGTYDGVIAQLAELKRFGVTAIEIMPLAEFPGRFNWGYDGVSLFAPPHVYGRPDELKKLVDRAHAIGLGVILDVVYNHLGPDGNYFRPFSEYYFTDRRKTDWGEAINYDGEGSAEVRKYFIQNACYWVSEFHMDGLRLDATQNIYDSGPRHVLAEIAREARNAVGGRSIVLIAEDELQRTKLVHPAARGGYGLDGVWADDFHHSARVAITGKRESYYCDYLGSAQEIVSALKRGHLYQGQFCQWKAHERGEPVVHEPASAFVFYLQNHDQIANSLKGERIHSVDLNRYRALAAAWLLGPETPFFFMGQEYGASQPFLFFADHKPELAQLVHQGRKEFLSQFPSYKEAAEHMPDPSDARTFENCKLDFSERGQNRSLYRFHEDLLRIRREDPVIAAQSREHLDGAVLSPHAFVIRYYGKDKGDRLLVVNLACDLHVVPVSEPLLAPVEGGRWEMVWSSEDPLYGGKGAVSPRREREWMVPEKSAAFFKSAV